MDKIFFTKLVTTPSFGHSVICREKDVITLIRQYLEKRLPELRFFDDAKASVPYVFASVNESPDIIFACHADTVPPSNKNHTDPVYDGDRCLVLGGKDMKAGIAVAIGAILCSSFRNRVALLIYGDEEYDQKGIVEMSTYLPTILKKSPKVIVCPESRFNLVHSSRGISILDVTARGVKAHSARPHQGIDAIKIFYEAFRILEEEYGKITDLGKTIFTITGLEGGVEENNKIKHQPNISPDIVHAVLSIRMSDDTMKGKNYAKIFRSLLERLGLNVEIDIRIDHGIRRTPDAIIRKLLDIGYKQCGQKLEVGDPKLSGYNDVAILGEALKSPVVNFGPYGEGNHTANEWVSMDSMEMTENILKSWIDNFS